MPRTRVHSMLVSVDGFAAGNHVTAQEPIGGAEALANWYDGRVIHGIQALSGAAEPITADRALFSLWGQGIGAEIMGRRKFGPQSGPWPEDGWRGWWGEEPPFRTPVFVLSHYPREPLHFANGTSFHFLDATVHQALQIAQQAAGGLDVRIGGGPSTVRQFLEADLIDFMHLVIVPLVLGTGVSLWDGIPGIQQRFTVESIGTSGGVTHQLWNRNRGD